MRDNLNDALSLTNKLSNFMQKDKSTSARFQFNKGVLYHAIENGYIIIWDNIEQAKPQVL
jgi:hypothetical protein